MGVTFSSAAIALRRGECATIPPCKTQQRKDEPESKFAEVIRKGKEKRAVMNEQSQKRAQAEEQSLQREEANQVDRAFTDIKDSEI